MKFAIVLATTAVLVSAKTTWAQRVDIAVAGMALVSFQPVDDYYVGGPYLNEGIGGLAPGFGAGLSAIFANGFLVAAELTTGRFKLRQGGRLVPGPPPPGPDGSFIGGLGTTRLHDTLLGGLVGYARGAGKTRAMFLVGAAAVLGHPTVDVRDGEHVVIEDGERSQVVPTGGLDVVRAVSPRISFVIGARYTFISRITPQRYLGIGPHVLRGGGGVRIKLD